MILCQCLPYVETDAVQSIIASHARKADHAQLTTHADLEAQNLQASAKVGSIHQFAEGVLLLCTRLVGYTHKANEKYMLHPIAGQAVGCLIMCESP